MTTRLFLLAAAATGLFAENFTGRVVGISDGDTIRVMHEGRAERVRLWGIDTPDSGSPGASGAKQFTGDAAYGKTVTVRVRDIHRYKRTVPRLRSVFHLRTCCQPSAICATEKLPADLDSMPDDLAVAVLAYRSNRVNGTLKAVERVMGSRRNKLERLVVIVTANLTTRHVRPPLFRTIVFSPNRRL